MAALKVLCVDDNASALNVRQLLLQQLGCEVVLATDANSALNRMSEAKPDIVLLDYHLADGEDGGAVARDMKAISGKTPIVFLTGDAAIPDAAKQSVDAVVIKGTNPRELLALLQKLVPDSSIREPKPKLY